MYVCNSYFLLRAAASVCVLCVCTVPVQHRYLYCYGTYTSRYRYYIHVALVRCTYISGFDSSSTPEVFYTYFYNHARRLRLEKLLYLELSKSPNLKCRCFWIQVAVSEGRRPPGVELESKPLAFHLNAEAVLLPSREGRP
jgi:hypothetical protein